MNGVDSVESLVITGAAGSSDPAVLQSVRNAEFVFFAGGDQCNYVNFFKGTPVEAAARSVYNRGGALGGTSAGLAVEGEYIYDACNSPNGIKSDDALKNPYDEQITFTYGFLNVPDLAKTITDTHFVTRDRMGRLLTFLGRQIADGVTTTAWGLAVNEGSSVTVDANGLGTVVGDGPAYLVLADHAPSVCAPRKALSYENYKIWKYTAGATINLRNRPTAGYYTISVNKGALSADPY